MKTILLLALLSAFPLLPWKRMYQRSWAQFELWFPGSVEQFDVLLRKKWPMVRTHHLFLFSFLLVSLSVLLFLLGTFFEIPVIPLPVGVTLGILLPFLAVYMLKPGIESAFLFEVRLIYSTLRTQIKAGATPKEALMQVGASASILKKSLQEILLVWGGDVEPILEEVAERYETDELNLLLLLIREMHQAGASNHQEVMQAFEKMKEMMEDEIAAKEAMQDEKEMEIIEMSSTANLVAVFFLMVIPIVGDIIHYFNQL